MSDSVRMPFDILLVEDNDFDARRVLRALAKIRAPHRLARAVDGQDALKLLHAGLASGGRPGRVPGQGAGGAAGGIVPPADAADANTTDPRTPARDDGIPDGREIRRPCVVLLDLNMPVMGGLPFLDALRRDARLADTPVVVMTTSEFYKDVERAHAHNVCGYLVKPVDADAMIDMTRRVIAFLDICVLPT